MFHNNTTVAFVRFVHTVRFVMHDYPDPPDPSELRAEAELEEPRVRLRPYLGTIRTLRQKGFSWREIAAWFDERGLTVDHTKIYRLAKAHETPENQLIMDERESRGIGADED